MIWQSILSLTPPWPGIELAKSFIFIALFSPDAKNPPNGPIILANSDNIITCACNFVISNGKYCATNPPYTRSKSLIHVGYENGINVGSTTLQVNPGIDCSDDDS